MEVLDNQVNVLRQLSLPRLLVGSKPIPVNYEMSVPTIYVDDILKSNGVYVTVFQRMGEEGSMLRVATNIKAPSGRRAIGTFITPQLANGDPNPVLSAVLSGKT